MRWRKTLAGFWTMPKAYPRIAKRSFGACRPTEKLVGPPVIGLAVEILKRIDAKHIGLLT